jgi:kynurenine formamidase
MSRVIWLSHRLDVNGPRPPAIPAPSLEPLYTIEKDQASVQILRVASHTGTHVDTPAHVIPDGLTLDDYSPEEFMFSRPAVVDLPLPPKAIVQAKDIDPLLNSARGADVLLVRFNYGAIREFDPDLFAADSPGFGVEACRLLRERCPELRCLGLDVQSLACIAHLDETMAAHNELLGGRGSKFLVIEDMDLRGDLDGLREVRVNPWLVHGMDSGPCSVVGILD